MTRARSSLVSVADTPYYHCICRCVRRAFLCGEDPVSGRSFSHRRQWVLERLRLLADVFAIDLCAYALMSNHYHLVVRLAPERTAGWSEDSVIDRWTRLFAGSELVHRYRRGEALGSAELAELADIVATWRDRLGDLSWFMRCLNESIARQANAEDGCTGRFWEGRFKTQALLDEAALVTAMAYVDLNPVRAGMAPSLQTSEFTSVQARLLAATGEHATAQEEPAAPIPAPLLACAGDPQHDTREPLPFQFQDYAELLDTSGRGIREGKRAAPAEPPPRLLATLGIEPAQWLPTVTQLQARFELVIGAPQRLRRLAEAKGRRWFRGRTAASRLYAQGKH